MKVTGKNPRMFLGDKEIKGITSFSFDNSADFPDVASPFSEKETVEFSGIYDPSCTDGESRESISAKLGDEFMGTITLPNGEKRDALLRAIYEDGIVTLSPVDEDVREWVRGWIRAGDKGGLII